MTAADKLEPCPFCGDAMEISADTIRHREQGTCPIGQYAWAATPRYLAAWNTRTTLKARDAEIAGLRRDVRHLIHAIDRGYFSDPHLATSAFVKCLREYVEPGIEPSTEGTQP